MFLPGPYAKHWQLATSQATDDATRKPWHTRNSTAVWRGNFGCAIGCGRKGKFYNPAVHADSCIDVGGKVPNVGVADVRGYTLGCEGQNYFGGRHDRIRLVRLSADNPSCVDAGFVMQVTRGYETQSAKDPAFLPRSIEKNAGSANGSFPWFLFGKDELRRPEQELAAEAFGWLKPRIEGFNSHQIHIHVGNNGFADRLWKLLAAGAVVLFVDNGWREWYYSALRPMVHYIPGTSPLRKKRARPSARGNRRA